jgi:hypothetical protein
MINITVNGKQLEREFQNMAQALAFAYQNGECYGAEIVELALEGKGWKSDGTGVAGAFTQADIDPACEKTKEEVIVTFATQLEAKDAEIAELKTQLEAKEAEVTEPPADQIDPTTEPPITEPVTDPAAGSGDVANPTDGSEPVEEAGVDNTAQA